MTKWLDIARKYDGLAEVSGPKANPVILGWLQHEGGGKSWVKDDATPWCGAAMAAVFTEAGLAAVIPKEPLRARAWGEAGVPISKPQVGCIVVLPRGKSPAQGHVGIVESFTATTLDIRGGNQANRFGVDTFARKNKDGSERAVAYRWPVPLVTPKDLIADGSRIATAAARQKADAVKGGAIVSSPQVPLPVPDVRASVDSLVSDVSWAQSVAHSLGDFTSFAGARWPVIALLIAGYFGARMLWDAYTIQQARTADANEGWTT